MAIVSDEGIVLKTYALGDTSRIVVAYTREHGMVRLVAKGARKTPSRFGFALEPLSRSRLVFYLKPDRDLQLVSQAETLLATGSKIGDLSRLAHAQAAVELIDRLVWGEEPHRELYDLLAGTLVSLLAAPVAALAAVTIAYQLQAASLLGYRPRLEACVICNGGVSARRVFSSTRGGMLCDRCASAEPGVIALSADALAGLSLLITRPVDQAAQFVEVKREGEILRVVENFLTHHFQRFKGLRSLEVLRSLPDSPIREDSPCPN